MSEGFKKGLALVACTAIMTGLLIAPVGAHVTRRFGHLWSQHIKPRVAWELVSSQVTIPANSSEFISVSCPAGKRPTGGGVDALQSNGAHSTLQRVIESYPTTSSWQALVRNDGTDARTARVYAICTRL